MTENFARVGEPIDFTFDCKPADELLPYPDAHLENIRAQLTVTFLRPNVDVQGKIVCSVSGRCDRCLDDVSAQIEVPFHQVFYKDVAEDEDGYVYTGSKLDATKAVCDEIVLSMPTNLLCKPDCKGLCPKCGCNLNERQCGCDTAKENAFAALKNLKF